MVHEKAHGTNFGCVYTEDNFHVKSRNNWIKFDKKNIYWKIFASTPEIMEFCKSNPNMLLLGEGYGMQKANGLSFRYGLPGYKEVGFMAFDVMKPDKTFLEPDDLDKLLDRYDVPKVPHISTCEFNLDKLKEMANGPSLLTDKHPREGCVIKPIKERQDERFNRVIAKIIGDDYES